MAPTSYTRIGGFLLQASVGTVGVLFVSAILGFCLAKLVFGSGTAPLENAVSFPGTLVVGFIMGYLINRRLHRRSAKWVWVIPLVWIAILMNDFSHYRGPGGSMHEIWISFFSNQCDSSECLYELAGTFPFIGSVGYSVGAWLALRVRPYRPSGESALGPSHN
jgi:hypothetical protein